MTNFQIPKHYLGTSSVGGAGIEAPSGFVAGSLAAGMEAGAGSLAGAVLSGTLA